MQLYALAGRRTDAEREYERLFEALDEELGMVPGPATASLYEEIRARHADEPELSSDLWERVGDLRVMAGDAQGAAKAFDLALAAVDNTEASARIERKCGEAFLMAHRPDLATPYLTIAEQRTHDPAEQGRLARALANL